MAYPRVGRPLREDFHRMLIGDGVRIVKRYLPRQRCPLGPMRQSPLIFQKVY